MTFVTKSSAQADTPEQPVSNASFWPEIDPAEVRTEQRIDTAITPERLRAVLIEAIATVNRQLADFRDRQIADGHNALEDIPTEMVDDVSVHVHRYRRAVGCLAKALLTERSRDFDTTAAGNKKADQLEPTIDDLHRDARWAICDIQGIGRTTVELI